MFKYLRQTFFISIIMCLSICSTAFAAKRVNFTIGGDMFNVGKITSAEVQGEYTLINDAFLVHTSQWVEYQQLLANGYPEVLRYEVPSRGMPYTISSYQLLNQARVEIEKSKRIEITDEYNLDHLTILKFIVDTYGTEYLYDKSPNDIEITEPTAGAKKSKKNKKNNKKTAVANNNNSAQNVSYGNKTSSKKGALLIYSADDILDLGCSQVAINYTLGSQSGYLDMAKQLHSKGIKITLIITSRIPLNEETLSSNPDQYKNPILYMPDLTNANVRMTFDDMLNDWGGIVDNYVIGNEISDQIYCYYKPCFVEEYVAAYCNSFKQAYSAIKNRKPSAKVFIPFDQSWNMPALSKASGRYDANLSRFKYNSKEMLQLIRQNLDNNVDWGVAAHPYPDPLTSAIFWDDSYASNNEAAMVVTMNNIEVMCNFLSQPEMRRADGSPREILISEIGFSDNEGDDVAAAALMYAWTKIENNNQIIGFLYNNNDFPFGSETEKVFRSMDHSNREEAIAIMNNVLNPSAN